VFEPSIVTQLGKMRFDKPIAAELPWLPISQKPSMVFPVRLPRLSVAVTPVLGLDVAVLVAELDLQLSVTAVSVYRCAAAELVFGLVCKVDELTKCSIV
jgi:hypothetical protein